MKLYEIAQQAIDMDNRQLAESLMVRLEARHGLNYPGIMEYLEAHGVDPVEFEETLHG